MEDINKKAQDDELNKAEEEIGHTPKNMSQFLNVNQTTKYTLSLIHI